MDHQGRFHEAALALDIPGEEIRRFIGHLRLTIRLTGGSVPSPEGTDSPRALAVDGADLPLALAVDGADLPLALAVDGADLPLALAVDCAALPRVDGFALPAGGTLLFFLDHENDHLAAATGEQKYAQVVHTPAAVAQHARATLRAELPDWFEPDEEEDDLSPFEQQRAEDLKRDLPHLDELITLADDLWPPDGAMATAHLGGYVDDEVMTSIAEQTATDVPTAKWYSHVEKEKHRLASEWLTLARFPLPDDYYQASFVIRHDDLAAGRFDRAYSVTTFSE
ncbi:DUF1963 domain-containing protein [Actinoplanes sp. CA-054009]